MNPEYIFPIFVAIVVAGSSVEQAVQNSAACAAKVQSAASADLGKMGLSVISFTIRNSRPA
jgi:hypothetical protein